MVSESLGFLILNIFFTPTILKISVKHFLPVLGLHGKVLVVGRAAGVASVRRC